MVDKSPISCYCFDHYAVVVFWYFGSPFPQRRKKQLENTKQHQMHHNPIHWKTYWKKITNFHHQFDILIFRDKFNKFCFPFVALFWDAPPNMSFFLKAFTCISSVHHHMLTTRARNLHVNSKAIKHKLTKKIKSSKMRSENKDRIFLQHIFECFEISFVIVFVKIVECCQHICPTCTQIVVRWLANWFCLHHLHSR